MTIHLISTISKHEWPPIWHKCYNIFQNLPYEVKLWNREDIVSLALKHNKEFYEEYLSKLDEIYLIDYVRYIILDKFGGAYFDLDVELIVDYLPMLDGKTTYFLEGGITSLISNAIMISYKECTMWEHILHKVEVGIIENFELARQDSYNTVFLAGPIFLSNWVAKFWNLQRQNGTFYPNIELLGYHQFYRPTNTFSFSKHHSTHIWGGNKENQSR
jgi:mannosyltransferase OCH1-like enzyme